MAERALDTMALLCAEIDADGAEKIREVYKVRLDALYYNDQNDRIATWITKYESENGKASLSYFNTDIYNRTIENFIYDSNAETFKGLL